MAAPAADGTCPCLPWVLNHSDPHIAEKITGMSNAMMHQPYECFVCGAETRTLTFAIAKCRAKSKMHCIAPPVCHPPSECMARMQDVVDSTAGITSMMSFEDKEAIAYARREFVLSSASCAGCGFARLAKNDTVPPLKMCSGCGGEYYCSAKCQHAHWPTHKLTCKMSQEKAPPPCSKPQRAVTPQRCPCLSDIEYGAQVHAGQTRCAWHKCTVDMSARILPFEFHMKVCPHGPAHIISTAFHSASCRRKYKDATGSRADNPSYAFGEDGGTVQDIRG